MVKNIIPPISALMLMLWSCATYQPPPPSLHIENLPPNEVSRLTLDERLTVEDAWQSMKQGNTNKAIKLLARLGQESPFFYVGMGYTAYIQQDLPSAENYFKVATIDFPDLAMAHLGLGQIYQETGRDDLAFSAYREVLKYDPDHPWAKARYAEIQEMKTAEFIREAERAEEAGNTEATKTAYLRALHYSPQAIEVHLALAAIYTREEQYDNATIHFKAAMATESENTETLAAYADALFQSGNNSQSLETYERLMELNPDDEMAQQRIEILKNRLGIFELPSQYNIISAAETVTKEQVAALLGVKFKAILPVPQTKPPIIIDISTSWASRFILDAASLGLLDVYPNHTFQPQKIITRAEMAEILHRLIRQLERQGYRFIQQIPPERIQIADVSPDNFYYRPIVLMISYDLMSLAAGRHFNPDRLVSGAEADQTFDLILALIQ